MKISFKVECDVDLKASDIVTATGFDMTSLIKLIKKMAPLKGVANIMAALMDTTPQQKFFLLVYGLDSLMVDTMNIVKEADIENDN